MESQQTKKEQIEVAGPENHFLYLPVRYALSQGWYGYVDSDYDFEYRTHRIGTDRQALEALLDNESPEFRHVKLAVCDPAVVYDLSNSEASTVGLLAALVKNTAFWAVDRGTHDIHSLADLGKFDEIIAYKEGSTAYAIAEHVSNISGGHVSINSVVPQTELQTLRDSENNSVALSPEVLDINILRSTNAEYRVELNIGSTREYGSVLVTALLARQDFVQTNPQVVSGVLRAIQESLMRARGGDREIRDYAIDLKGREYERAVRSAIETAKKDGLWPASIEIGRHEWLGACESHCMAQATMYDEQKASKLFEAIYTVNRKLVSDAISESFSAITQVRSKTSSLPSLAGLSDRFINVLLLMLAGSVVASAIFAPWIVSFIFGVAAYGVTVDVMVRRQFESSDESGFSSAWHWISLGLVAIGVALAEGNVLPGSLNSLASAGLVGTGLAKECHVLWAVNWNRRGEIPDSR